MEKTEQHPIISVIVPMYNVANYIGECIESLKKQTFSHFECLLIDDGSTDGTLKITKQLIKDDQRFQIKTQKNGGPAKARNTGLVDIQGDFILFVDSDDKLAENGMELLFNKAKEEDTGIVLGKTLRFNESKVWEVPSHIKHELTIGDKKNIGRNPELFYAMGPAAKLFRKDIIDSLLFDEGKQFAEDQLFVFSAYLKAQEINVIDEVIYYYRVRENEESLTQKYRNNPVENLKTLLELMNEAHEKVEPEQNGIIIVAYYNRLFEIELRVLFKNILLSKKNKQIEFYQLFLNFMNQKRKIVVMCSNYYEFIMREQLMYLFLVKGAAMNSLIQIMDLSVTEENKSEKLQKELLNVMLSSTAKRQWLKLKALMRKVRKGK
ncbi:glycosyltransferase family 2 protein [Vagococcus fluvialis]|uniref:glycosyltransferase family 2 protein n=1 Tax=Vagococcus fluvialis TaxID=2738 RepID=UPI00203456C4|nr:glycosyltransferase family 2 protein [Vagococcus fluvialis]MCM2138022.1 glycosyltransferase [Vagococcus fluvialis]